MSRISSIRFIVVSVLVLAGLVAPAAVTHAGSSTTLKMISTLSHVDVTRYGSDNGLFLPSSIYMAATGGAFEIDVTAADDGSLTLTLVQRNGNNVRAIHTITPIGPAFLSDGLPNFFRLRLREASNQIVASALLPFCPSGGYGQSRVNGSGPDRGTYPYSCGTSMLTKATVWGIDKGWASSVPLTLSAANVPDGNYTLLVDVMPKYLSQLGIPEDASSTSLSLTITTLPDQGPCAVDVPCPRGASVASARRGETGARTKATKDRFANDGVSGTTGVPDMQALPAHDLTVEQNPDDQRDYLSFGATIWNGGTGPLVVEGFRSGPSDVMPATQFIYRNGKPVRSKVVGRFEYDRRPGHNHWHMEDAAQYDLLDANQHRIVLSGKQSFCLAPTDAIDLVAKGADWQPDRSGLWSACAGEESIWIREVMPAGWGDTYFQSVAGQSFDVTNIENGTYILRVTADPFHRIVESSYKNNVSLLKIQLGGAPGSRTVLVVGTL